MTSVAAPSPLLALADPSFARTGPAGAAFAPVLASLLALAEAVPVPPAIGTSVPLPGKPLPEAQVVPDLFEEVAPRLAPEDAVSPLTRATVVPRLADEVAPVVAGPRAPLPTTDRLLAVVEETAPEPLQPVDVSPSRSPERAVTPPDDQAPPAPLTVAREAAAPRSSASRPRATPDANQGDTEPAAIAGVPLPSAPDRDEAPSPSHSTRAAARATGSNPDRFMKADGPPPPIVSRTPPLVPEAAAEALITTVAAPGAATTRSPTPPPAAQVAAVKVPSIKTGYAPRPARFVPSTGEPTPGIGDVAPPAVAATDAHEQRLERDEQVAAVDPAPPPSGDQGVVASAMLPPVPLAPLPDPARAEAVVVATRVTDRGAQSPPTVPTPAGPLGRETRDAAGVGAIASTGSAPTAAAAPSSDGTPSDGQTATVAASQPALLRKAGQPAVDATAAAAPGRPVPVSSVVTVLPAAAPATGRAVVSEPVPVAVPEPVARVVVDAALPPPPILSAPAVRPVSATPAEPSPTVAVAPRPDNAPRSPARVAPVEQSRVELAAPVILPALQAFGVQLHRAAAAERRSLPAIDASVLASAPAPAAAPAEPAPIDATRPDWPQAMVARIEQLRERHEETDTRIRLHPDALGTVEVTLRREADGTHVRLDAAEPATRALLADAQPRLQALAETRGLRLSGSEVAGGSAQGSTGGWTGNDRRPPAPAPLAPARRHATDAPDDSTDTRLA